MSRPSKVTPAMVRAIFKHTAKGLTSVQIADKVGLSASTVRKLRTGQLPLDLACTEVWQQTFGSQTPGDSVNNRSKPPSVDQKGPKVTSHQTPATAPATAPISRTAKKLAPEVSTTPEAVPVVPSNETEKEEPMLLPKQVMSTDARKRFGLFVNPFEGEVTCDAEMFVNGEIRFVREAAWQAAIGGRFVAIIGESGAGKSTILDALKYQVRKKDGNKVVFVEPSVLGMEDSDTKGKTLKSAAIETAIVMTLDSLVGVAPSQEKRTRQIQRMLQESTIQGRSHLVVIEEAHSLPIPTLKHLKRLWEKCRVESNGDKYYKSMLGVLLLGQPELEQKLNRFDAREVMQRCELVRLPHLGDDLSAYLRFRAEIIGRKLDEFITQDGIDALKTRLTVAGGDQGGKVMLMYPLNVNNWMIAALNAAAGVGAPRIDRDVVALV